MQQYKIQNQIQKNSYSCVPLRQLFYVFKASNWSLHFTVY